MAAVLGILAIVLVLILLWLVASGVRVVQEYERGVLFVFGRCRGARGPGIFVVPPFISRIVRVNLQTQAVPVASQQVITKDNVTVAVDAVAYFRVKDPVASVLKIQNWYNAAQLVAQTSLRVDHRPPRARPAARRTRPDQSGAEGRARPADRVVGCLGRAGGDPRRRASRADAAARWPARPRRSGSGGRRSSRPRARCRPRRSWARRPR